MLVGSPERTRIREKEQDKTVVLERETSPERYAIDASSKTQETTPNPEMRSPLATIQLATIEKGSAVPSTSTGKVTAGTYIPSPFKRALFWPNDSQPMKRKRTKERTPAVVTSPQMIEYFDKKTKKKVQEEAERERKRLEREEKKKIALEKKKERTRYRRLSSSDKSSESSSNPPFDESDNEVSDGSETQISVEDVKSIKEGDFVLVSFMGGKRNASRFIYLCCIQAIEGDEVRVLGFKSTDTSAKNFVANEDDVSIITPNQIISILPAPEVTMRERRLTYIFTKKLAVKEKF